MTWNKGKAKDEIRNFFKKHGVSARAATSSATDGKVYELYCLVELLSWLKNRYRAHIKFESSTVDFKASAGNIDRNRSYFKISANGQTLELHTDIEVQTLGSTMSTGAGDESGYHEIDLVLIDPGVADGQKPTHDQLLLGVECKAHANFGKAIVRQVLGIRRELSMYDGPQQCELDRRFGKSPTKLMMAKPATLYWLAFTDSKGLSYCKSPGTFEIEFKNWKPWKPEFLQFRLAH